MKSMPTRVCIHAASGYILNETKGKRTVPKETWMMMFRLMRGECANITE